MKNVMTFVFVVALALGLATTVYAQSNPCNVSGQECIVYSNAGGSAVVIVSVNPGGAGVITQSIPVVFGLAAGGHYVDPTFINVRSTSPVVTQNIPLPDGNGFYQIAASVVRAFSLAPYQYTTTGSGFLETAFGRFPAYGGWGYGATMGGGMVVRFPISTDRVNIAFGSSSSLAQTDLGEMVTGSNASLDVLRSQCLAVAHVVVEWCNRNGVLLRPSMDAFGNPNYQGGETYMSIADLVAGPVGSNTLYVTTPDVNAIPGTGQLLALGIDPNTGDITSKTPIVNLDVQNDGVVRLAVGNLGVYYVQFSNGGLTTVTTVDGTTETTQSTTTSGVTASIMMLEFHGPFGLTPVQVVPPVVITGPAVTPYAFGALAVISANAPPLQ